MKGKVKAWVNNGKKSIVGDVNVSVKRHQIRMLISVEPVRRTGSKLDIHCGR